MDGINLLHAKEDEDMTEGEKDLVEIFLFLFFSFFFVFVVVAGGHQRQGNRRRAFFCKKKKALLPTVFLFTLFSS